MKRLRGRWKETAGIGCPAGSTQCTRMGATAPETAPGAAPGPAPEPAPEDVRAWRIRGGATQSSPASAEAHPASVASSGRHGRPIAAAAVLEGALPAATAAALAS